MYSFFLHTYQYLTTSLGDGTGSNVQTEFSAQTTTMIFLKLFIKLFACILSITMQTNGTYQLQNSGFRCNYSVNGCWKEHGNTKFSGLMPTLNNHYHLYMDEAIYLTLFENPTTKAILKSNALDLINDWYCGKILMISNQTGPPTETTTMMTMVKKIPFSYRARNEDFVVIDDLEDLYYILDLYFDKNNDHPEVKNFGKWRNNDEKYAVLYKETLFLYPTEQRISSLDWTKITE